MKEGERYPRPLSEREISWLRLLLPAGHPGYDALRERAEGLHVLGIGRWGEGDLMLGRPGLDIDPGAGMTPVAASGMILAETPDGALPTITLTLHQPGDDGGMELHAATLDGGPVPVKYAERSRWSYSCWLPGDPCPADGSIVREISLDDAATLRLVIAPVRRVLWLYDSIPMTNTLLPVTGLYNELMLLKGIRDPAIALDQRRLFTALGKLSDEDLRAAFTRYNMSFRKTDPERLLHAADPLREVPSLLERIRNVFRGRS